MIHFWWWECLCPILKQEPGITHVRKTANEFELILIFEFDGILSLIPVVGCLRQCWPSSTERGWERVKKEFLGERIKAWAVGSVRGSFEVAPTIRLGPGGCGPTFEAPDRPMQLRLPQTYRFPAFSYYPGTISVAKRILNLNCPPNFWVTDSFEVKIREKVELSIFLHFPIHVEFGQPSALYLLSSQVPTGGNLFIQSHCKVWSDYSTFRTWIVLQVNLYLGTVAING